MGLGLGGQRHAGELIPPSPSPALVCVHVSSLAPFAPTSPKGSLVVCRLDLASLDAVRAKMPVVAHRRTDLFRLEERAAPTGGAPPLSPPVVLPHALTAHGSVTIDLATIDLGTTSRSDEEEALFESRLGASVAAFRALGEADGKADGKGKIGAVWLKVHSSL